MPYLRSEYGKDYDFDAPVKLLDSMMHAMADEPDQQVVVLSQVNMHFRRAFSLHILRTQPAGPKSWSVSMCKFLRHALCV